MKFLILGDVHGDWTAMNITIARAIRKHPDITHIVQMGDFGYGWGDNKPFKASKSFLDNEAMEVYKNAERLWLDGNHENFDKLDLDEGAWQPGWKYMPRGSVIEVDGYRAMFFGGASSIDKPMRIEHISWWPQESITYGQVVRTLESVDGQIDAIFSHEHPASVPYSDKRYGGKPFGDGDKNLLEVLKQKYLPKFWFFGHHHTPDTGTVDGTEWFCCPIIEYFQYVIWTGEKAFTDS
jgi:predicted phosphodiesterase